MTNWRCPDCDTWNGTGDRRCLVCERRQGQDAALPGDYTDPREYLTHLLAAAFPDAYAFDGAEEADVEAYLALPDGVAQLQRYVADHSDARIPDPMRDRLRELAA